MKLFTDPPDLHADAALSDHLAQRLDALHEVFAGLGLVIAGMMLGDRGMAAGGLIPAFIGIGYLVSHRLATAEDEPPIAADGTPRRDRGGDV